MFTGIVQGKATVESNNINNGIMRLVVKLPKQNTKQLLIGASVAINGCCLTVVNTDNFPLVPFDVIDETLNVTNLGNIKSSDTVNFERSAKVGDEIGGHTVSGHVSALAIIKKIDKNQDNVSIRFEIDQKFTAYIFDKGFVALDGCSLTVCDVKDNQFSVSFIPETLQATIFGDHFIGKQINFEIDSSTQTTVDTIKRLLPDMLKNIELST
ncbi:MAG: riboflavin synthase subunit alpha [Saccharospirillaceae bacterium]|nr:riboflavin synthase subunit alpha [Pseudomonadales bacterium]NRB79544.1 riboflavin synthase subunit alpha [Saccharospirillaceae bacterium]